MAVIEKSNHQLQDGVIPTPVSMFRVGTLPMASGPQEELVHGLSQSRVPSAILWSVCVVMAVLLVL